ENRIAVPDESYRRVNLRQHGSASQNPDFPNTGSKAKNTSGTPYPTQQSVKMKVVALRDGCFFRAVFEHIRLSEATLLQGSQQAALHEVVWSLRKLVLVIAATHIGVHPGKPNFLNGCGARHEGREKRVPRLVDRNTVDRFLDPVGNIVLVTVKPLLP